MIEKIKAMTDEELIRREKELDGIEDSYPESRLIYQEYMRRIAEEASKLCNCSKADPAPYRIARCIAAPGDMFSQDPLDFQIAETLKTFGGREEAEEAMEEFQPNINPSIDDYRYEEFVLFGPVDELLAISSEWNEIIIEGKHYVLDNESWIAD